MHLCILKLEINMKSKDVIIDPTLPLDEFLGQAVGAASTCWSDMAGQGIFESERALQIVNEIKFYIFQMFVDHRNEIADEIGRLAVNHNPDDPEMSKTYSDTY